MAADVTLTQATDLFAPGALDPGTIARRYLPAALHERPWRAHALDGKLLLFERATGLNALLEGAEVAHLRRAAPRTLLIAVTNFCNLSCAFCYRDQTSPSGWRYDTLLAFCQQASAWGVLEAAFGGGEPLIFPRWAEFLRELHATSALALNFTTNGTLLTADFLRAVQGCYGQMRLSLYADNDYEATLRLLAEHDARYGVNWLITPAELSGLAAKFRRLLDLGVRDFLLLGYKGAERALHLSAAERDRFGRFVRAVHEQLGPAVSLKLDACWGDALPHVPRLFAESDCGAGDEIVSLTSDLKIKPCSFHAAGVPFETLEEVRVHWQRTRAARAAAQIAGCARLPEHGEGLMREAGRYAPITLAEL